MEKFLKLGQAKRLHFKLSHLIKGLPTLERLFKAEMNLLKVGNPYEFEMHRRKLFLKMNRYFHILAKKTGPSVETERPFTIACI